MWLVKDTAWTGAPTGTSTMASMGTSWAEGAVRAGALTHLPPGQGARASVCSHPCGPSSSVGSPERHSLLAAAGPAEPEAAPGLARPAPLRVSWLDCIPLGMRDLPATRTGTETP